LPAEVHEFFVTFTLCIFAGATVEFVARRAKKWQWAIIVLVALLPLEPLVAAHMRLLDATFAQDSPPFPLAATPFRQEAAFEGAVRGAHRPLQANMYWLLRQNQGTIDWTAIFCCRSTPCRPSAFSKTVRGGPIRNIAVRPI